MIIKVLVAAISVEVGARITTVLPAMGGGGSLRMVSGLMVGSLGGNVRSLVRGPGQDELGSGSESSNEGSGVSLHNNVIFKL